MTTIKKILNPIRKKFVIILIGITALLSSVLIASANLNDCGLTLCNPEIIEGNVVDDIYFSGDISIGAYYQGELLESENSASYTIDALEVNPTWLSAEYNGVVDLNSEFESYNASSEYKYYQSILLENKKINLFINAPFYYCSTYTRNDIGPTTQVESCNYDYVTKLFVNASKNPAESDVISPISLVDVEQLPDALFIRNAQYFALSDNRVIIFWDEITNWSKTTSPFGVGGSTSYGGAKYFAMIGEDGSVIQERQVIDGRTLTNIFGTNYLSTISGYIDRFYEKENGNFQIYIDSPGSSTSSYLFHEYNFSGSFVKRILPPFGASGSTIPPLPTLYISDSDYINVSQNNGLRIQRYSETEEEIIDIINGGTITLHRFETSGQPYVFSALNWYQGPDALFGPAPDAYPISSEIKKIDNGYVLYTIKPVLLPGDIVFPSGKEHQVVFFDNNFNQLGMPVNLNNYHDSSFSLVKTQVAMVGNSVFILLAKTKSDSALSTARTVLIEVKDDRSIQSQVIYSSEVGVTAAEVVQQSSELRDWRLSSDTSGLLVTNSKLNFGRYYQAGKTLTTNLIMPNRNIDVQFRLDRPGQLPIYSPVSSYIYADLSIGSNGSIQYDDVLTNSSTVSVSLILPERQSGLYQNIQLSQRVAQFSNNNCGIFSAWQSIGSQTSLTEIEQVSVDENQCYQFKWVVTNNFGSVFEYTSNNIVKVDRTSPTINITSEQVIFNELQLSIAVDETTSGIANQAYQVNSATPVIFSGSQVNVPLGDGTNRIELTATDLAGNIANRVLYITADLTPAEIIIHSLEEGGVYSDNVPIEYSLTQELTDLTILVDGAPRSNLLGLANGAHTVEIQGRDAQSNLITKIVNFTIDNGVLSLAITSPQARTYQQNTITIAYQSSQPLDQVSYRLNGGSLQQGSVLEGLPDGDYSLELVGEIGGDNVSDSVQFTIQEGIPLLSVESPQQNSVLSSNNVQLIFNSNSPVEYEVSGLTGTVSSGQTLSLPEAGEHTLVLTATHPVSGNSIRQQIQFITDPVAPTIDLQSPREQLYSFKDIPIQFTPNKALKNVVMTLNGNAVNTLTDLPSGSHQFRVTAEDSAGRSVERVANFTVAYLDIVAPTQDEMVVSNTQPAAFSLNYAADGNFSSVTARIDDGVTQLITNPPGVDTMLQTILGEHELTLTGNLNEFNTLKRVSFELGAKNISVDASSIDYVFTNCDAEFNCDVDATLTVKNIGTFDVNETINVRFNHVNATGGTQTFNRQITGLEKGDQSEIVLETFQASLGDAFSIVVDPTSQILEEYTADNSYQVIFEPGRILEVKSALREDNIYIENISVINSFFIETVGAIDSVVFKTPSVEFVDDDRSNGFSLIADMGLLSVDNPCAEILAFNSAGILLDSHSICNEMKKVSINGLSPTTIFWNQLATFEDNTNKVLMNTLDIAQVLLLNAENTLNQLDNSVSISTDVSSDGSVNYKMLSYSTEQNNIPKVDMGSFPFLGDLSAQKAAYMTNINPKQGICTTEGAIPLFNQAPRQSIEEIYAEELAALREGTVTREQLVNQAVFGRDECDSTTEESCPTFNPNVFNPLYLTAAELLDTTLEYGIPIPLHGTVSENVFAGLDVLFTGFTRLTLSDTLLAVDVTGSQTQGFNSRGCVLVDRGNIIDVVFDANYEYSADVNINVRTGSASLNVFGIASLGVDDLGGIEILDVPLIPLIFVDLNFKIHPINLNLPIKVGGSLGLSLADGDIFLGPLHFWFDTRINHHQRLVDVKAFASVVVIGYGEQYKADLYANGNAKFNLIPTSDYASFVSNQPESLEDISSVRGGYAYASHDVKLIVKRRKKYCLGPFCKRGSWRVQNDLSRYDSDSQGTPYTQQEVNTFLAEREGTRIASIEGLIENLSALTAFYELIGRTDNVTQDLLACSVFQNLTVNMPNTPIYSNQTGVCELVVRPDSAESGVQYFSDAACQTDLPFKPQRFLEYCVNNLLDPANRDYIGNAGAWQADGDSRYNALGRNTKWTLAHGTSLDLLAVPVENNRRPFVKQIEYKTVNGCQLEMRTYKQDINATNLKPLMFIHGGSWKFRGFSAIGMEATISHLTERGYVVFAPYYRLMDDSDGPAECQNAPGEEIVVDVEDALQWVKDNGSLLGSDGSKVTLVGQSAGAHLAGWLASHPVYSVDVEKQLLFYPPTDARFFVEQSRLGGLYQATDSFPVAKGLMSQFLGESDIASVNVNDDFVLANSYPDKIQDGLVTSPVFMIHGNADNLVPVEMSTRLCDAKAGLAFGSIPTSGGEYSCGTDDSRLHIIENASHILDLKCFDNSSRLLQAFNLFSSEINTESDLQNRLRLDLPTKTCPSSVLSADAAKAAIQAGFNWLN